MTDTPRTGNADVDAQDRAVDRKIKSICRGRWIGVTPFAQGRNETIIPSKLNRKLEKLLAAAPSISAEGCNKPAQNES
jgi:hypothetical protein